MTSGVRAVGSSRRRTRCPRARAQHPRRGTAAARRAPGEAPSRRRYRRPRPDKDARALSLEVLGERRTQNLRDVPHAGSPTATRGTRELALALQAAGPKGGVPGPWSSATASAVPQEVEAAVYFCCLEALQNVAKYANGRERPQFSYAGGAQTVSFEVTDDGSGFDPARTTWGPACKVETVWKRSAGRSRSSHRSARVRPSAASTIAVPLSDGVRMRRRRRARPSLGPTYLHRHPAQQGLSARGSSSCPSRSHSSCRFFGPLSPGCHRRSRLRGETRVARDRVAGPPCLQLWPRRR